MKGPTRSSRTRLVNDLHGSRKNGDTGRTQPHLHHRKGAPQGALWLVSWMGLAMNEPAAVGVAFILAAVGGICLVVGLLRLRFFSAFDAVALHRWETLLAATNEETKKLADERKHRVEDDTNR